MLYYTSKHFLLPCALKLDEIIIHPSQMYKTCTSPIRPPPKLTQAHPDGASSPLKLSQCVAVRLLLFAPTALLVLHSVQEAHSCRTARSSHGPCCSNALDDNESPSSHAGAREDGESALCGDRPESGLRQSSRCACSVS